MLRRRIVLLTVTVLLALDAGRSYSARVGYARPTETWQPNPALYSDLAWPPGADLRPEASLGEYVYARRCAVCHGPDGRGNGPAAPSMIPRPRDFTLGLFKYKSTPRFGPPTDDDLRRVVKNGLTASAMPAFADLLTDEEIRAVVEEIRRLARLDDRALSPVAIPARPLRDERSIDRGRALYGGIGCAGCHGVDGRKTGFLEDAKRYPHLSAISRRPGPSVAEAIPRMSGSVSRPASPAARCHRTQMPRARSSGGTS